MSGKPVVHIIDNDESLRGALESLFRSIDLAARTYSSTRDFIDAPRPDALGCIVLDVRLPGMSGVDFQSQLAELGIRLPVVLMTGYGDIPMSVRAMKAGAIDFLPKPFRDQDMLDAVAAAIDRDRARRAADEKEAGLRERFATLSPREQQVMTLVTAGKLNKQVNAKPAVAARHAMGFADAQPIMHACIRSPGPAAGQPFSSHDAGRLNRGRSRSAR